MRIAWIALLLLVWLWAASVSVSLAQEAKTKKTTHRSHSHPAHTTHRAKQEASKPAKETEAYVNQGPVAPAADAEVNAATTESAVEAAPVVEPVVVTYQRGALAITTHEAPLREILDRVGEATGAIVEAPDSEQRISVTVAAEAPVQAIAALLDGLHLDYAMLGGTGEGDPVRRIIIAPRGSPMRGGPLAAAADASGGDKGAMEAPPVRPARNRD
jgi:hypothetical protein